jgi:hypothetical protein
MVELFQTTKQNVSLHIHNIFEEGELTPEATVKDYLMVQTEGSGRGRAERRSIQPRRPHLDRLPKKTWTLNNGETT